MLRSLLYRTASKWFFVCVHVYTGIILFLLTCFVAVVSRMYETRLLRISGANSESDYPEYLMVIFMPRSITIIYSCSVRSTNVVLST